MSDTASVDKFDDDPNRHLSDIRRRAAFAMAWERLWPLALPALGVIAAFLIVSWFGLWSMMSDWVRLGTLTLMVAGLFLTLPRLRHFSWPDAAAVDRRIEEISRFRNRPVTAQSDQQADLGNENDPFAKALWEEHRRRMAAGLDKARSGLPTPQIARRDPYALRAFVVLGLFVAAVAGRNDPIGLIGDAFRSHEAPAVITARVDAWIRPPAYTNRPPLFLSRAGERVLAEDAVPNVPEKSTFVLRALNLSEPSLTLETASGAVPMDAQTPEEAAEAGTTSAAGAVNYSAELETAGTIVLRDGTDEVARYDFTIIPDAAPTIAFNDDPSASTRGALEFTFTANDDYGIAKGEAVMESAEPIAEGARPLIGAPDVPLILSSRRPGDVSGRFSRDFSSHPWAGGKVRLTLKATDDAGQTGESNPRDFDLPGRVFVKPLAKAVVFERRRLALDANRQKDVAEMLDVITTTHPETFINNLSHYTALRVAYRHIDRAANDDALREGLDLLWEIALAIEDGALSAAERRLRDAQERLAEALENGASDEEIERLMDELRQAMNEFMRELAEQARRNPQDQQAFNQNQNMQTLRQQDLDRMMQQIEDLAKSGSRDAARELLRQLQEMMNNLQMAQPNQQQMQQDPFSQQMNELSDIMRQQQELMDRTFDMRRRQQELQQQQGQNQQGQQGQRDQQRQGQQGQQQQQGQGQNQQGQGQQRPMTAEELAEALRQLQEQQGQLQQRLQEMQEAMRGMGLDPGEQMDQAGEEMGQAEGNLGQGETGEATGNQSRALQALRDGAQQMMQNMQNQAGEQGRRGERGEHGEQTRSEADPLGRQSRTRGPQLGDDTKVPSEIDAQRAREILDAIRKRLGDIERPKLELDYLDRLLPTR